MRNGDTEQNWYCMGDGKTSGHRSVTGTWPYGLLECTCMVYSWSCMECNYKLND